DGDDEGRRVNAVARNTVATGLARAVLDTPGKLAAAAAKIPPGRLADPATVVAAGALLTRSGSDDPCGHTLAVDGGWLRY
ncbi:MAG: SDR family oxidoreductase, partial [Euzebyales bacterium]|nr:SDR family oxidoreductase [Euzebyales bacterium]MBA3621677.1 SDR family oxidoreductase [Euzebyales bacterium]